MACMPVATAHEPHSPRPSGASGRLHSGLSQPQSLLESLLTIGSTSGPAGSQGGSAAHAAADAAGGGEQQQQLPTHRFNMALGGPLSASSGVGGLGARRWGGTAALLSADACTPADVSLGTSPGSTPTPRSPALRAIKFSEREPRCLGHRRSPSIPAQTMGEWKGCLAPPAGVVDAAGSEGGGGGGGPPALAHSVSAGLGLSARRNSVGPGPATPPRMPSQALVKGGAAPGLHALQQHLQATQGQAQLLASSADLEGCDAALRHAASGAQRRAGARSGVSCGGALANSHDFAVRRSAVPHAPRRFPLRTNCDGGGAAAVLALAGSQRRAPCPVYLVVARRGCCTARRARACRWGSCTAARGGCRARRTRRCSWC